MTAEVAHQIAVLINSQNKLVKQYTTQEILAEAEDYFVESQGGRIIGAVRVQRKQWYQSEISHLSVHSDFRRSGIGTKLLQRALAQAIASHSRIAQCTIADWNTDSIRLFTRRGFTPTIEFYYPGLATPLECFSAFFDGKPNG